MYSHRWARHTESDSCLWLFSFNIYSLFVCIFHSFWSNCFWRVKQDGGGHGNPLQYSCLRSPWTEEPGGLQSMWSQRVGHDGATNDDDSKAGNINWCTSTLTLWIRRGSRIELQILENLEKFLSPKSPNRVFCCWICTSSFCDSQVHVLTLPFVGACLRVTTTIVLAKRSCFPHPPVEDVWAKWVVPGSPGWMLFTQSLWRKGLEPRAGLCWNISWCFSKKDQACGSWEARQVPSASYKLWGEKWPLAQHF